MLAVLLLVEPRQRPRLLEAEGSVGHDVVPESRGRAVVRFVVTGDISYS